MRMEIYMKRIEIGVASLKGGLREFARVWRSAAAGERLPEATPKVHFSSLAQLLSMLTPKRLELLDTVARKPGCSIRALAGRLGRDYKNVHGDVTALAALGLIVREAGGTLQVPYDELLITAPLTSNGKKAA